MIWWFSFNLSPSQASFPNFKGSHKCTRFLKTHVFILPEGVCKLLIWLTISLILYLRVQHSKSRMLSHEGRFPYGTVQSTTGCNLMTAVCSPMLPVSQKESSVTFALATKGTTEAHNKFPLPEILQLLKSYDLTQWFRYAYFLRLYVVLHFLRNIAGAVWMWNLTQEVVHFLFSNDEEPPWRSIAPVMTKQRISTRQIFRRLQQTCCSIQNCCSCCGFKSINVQIIKSSFAQHFLAPLHSNIICLVLQSHFFLCLTALTVYSAESFSSTSQDVVLGFSCG